MFLVQKNVLITIKQVQVRNIPIDEPIYLNSDIQSLMSQYSRSVLLKWFGGLLWNVFFLSFMWYGLTNDTARFLKDV